MTAPSTIDQQLNTRARAPHYDAANAAYAALSDAARNRLDIIGDVAYGPHRLERLDVLSDASPAKGAILWFHGGFWRSRDKADFHFLATGFARLGMKTVAIGYPKCPEVKLGRVVEAAINAFDFVAAKADELGLAGLPLFVGGHSAGAHLATMIAIARPEKVAGLISVSGLYELTPVRQSFANADLHLEEADEETLSPLRLPIKDAPPAVFLTGTAETDLFHEQAAAMAAAWSKGGGDGVAATAETADHYTILFTLSGGTHPSLLRVLSLSRGPAS